MAQLPTGTVTFLFTDIEGSTRLLQELGGDRYDGVQANHAEIMRRAIAAGGGTEIRTEGDSFFAVFPNHANAVRSAAAAQRDMASHPWPEDAVIRVRMGLHTGEGRLGGDDYLGIDVNRAARIAAAGHGGQVLLSDATRGLVEHELPDGVTVRDLGAHRLKDIAHPERLFDLVIEGLPAAFPALKTLDARPNNLPLQLTSFVGRDAEVAEAIRLLGEHRLVTLTGPGGTGKTRLALAVGAELLPRFSDGVFFVDLAPIVDPGQVCPAICQVLGVREEPGSDVIDTMVNRLLGQDILIVLDNFEHLLDAAPMVEEMLGKVIDLRILATSRTPLGLYGEQELHVPPLALPDPGRLPEVEALSEYEAVALFIDRAREARPGFELTAENAEAVAEICARLDGLPLAIELAASRIKILSPEAIRSRLDRSLDLLAATARNVAERQRTLRAAIEWSYGLLDEPGRRLFARLSVFAGGADLGAAETVANPDGERATLDGLASLVDNSLVRQTEVGTGEPRFGMLETIREYARERLDQDWDGEATRRRHGEHFLDMAEASEPNLLAEDASGLDRLELEHDNVQAALWWAVETVQADRGMRAAAAIWRFWQLRGHFLVGRAWLDRLLALPGEPTAARARAHGAAGSLAYWQPDLPETERHYGEALAISRELDDRAAIAEALYNLAFVPYIRGTGYEESIDQLREATALFEELGDEVGATKAQGDIPLFMMLLGDNEGALPLMEEALDRARDSGDTFRIVDNLLRVAQTHRILGHYERTRALCLEALEILERTDSAGAIAAVLQMLSPLDVAEGRHERAMRLYGAAEAITDLIPGAALPPLDEDPVRKARKAIGEEATDQALAEGRAMTLEEAVAYARNPDA